MLGPAECEAENVTWAWWAGGDIQLQWPPWGLGNTCQARTLFLADFGVAEAGLAEAASDGPLQPGRREETPPGRLLPGAVARHRWGCATCGCHASVGACAFGEVVDQTVLRPFSLGLLENSQELDQDVLVRICEWGTGRTMLRSEAKCFQ